MLKFIYLFIEFNKVSSFSNNFKATHLVLSFPFKVVNLVYLVLIVMAFSIISCIFNSY